MFPALSTTENSYLPWFGKVTSLVFVAELPDAVNAAPFVELKFPTLLPFRSYWTTVRECIPDWLSVTVTVFVVCHSLPPITGAVLSVTLIVIDILLMENLLNAHDGSVTPEPRYIY